MVICGQRDCFAFSTGQRNHCNALSETYPKGSCPFYKPKEQYQQETEGPDLKKIAKKKN